MKKNVIFLDIDGVLNTSKNSVRLHGAYKATNGYIKSRDDFGALFDPIACDNLIYLADTTKSAIVISSTWRKHGLQRMKDLFKFRGIALDIIDVTPILNKERGYEIEEWLLQNDWVEKYIIIDDDTDFTQEQRNNHLVHTPGENGLDHTALVRGLKLLMERV